MWIHTRRKQTSNNFLQICETRTCRIMKTGMLSFFSFACTKDQNGSSDENGLNQSIQFPTRKMNFLKPNRADAFCVHSKIYIWRKNWLKIKTQAKIERKISGMANLTVRFLTKTCSLLGELQLTVNLVLDE